MKFTNKTAVITGAGSGIGRAIALRFAAEGARIVSAELNEANGTETARLIQAQGGEALAVTTDGLCCTNQRKSTLSPELVELDLVTLRLGQLIHPIESHATH